jgi:hypothetical protein
MADKEDVYPSTFPPFPIGSGSDDCKALIDYLEKVHNFAVSSTLRQISWYNDNKQPNMVKAKRLRGLAIIFVAFGGLTPFIVGSGLLPNSNIIWTQIGYIFLGVAVCLIGLDKFFGYSSSWIRFMVASNTLQKHLAQFQYDWAILRAKASCSKLATDSCEPLLQCIQAFSLKAYSEIEKETSEWASEFRSNLSEMEKSARQQIEEMKPGSISLKLINAEKTKNGVTIFIDGGISNQGVRQNDYLLSPVFPGQHYIQVSGEINDKEVSISKIAQVTAGNLTILELKLE